MLESTRGDGKLTRQDASHAPYHTMYYIYWQGRELANPATGAETG